jgi:hypothetical protein
MTESVASALLKKHARLMTTTMEKLTCLFQKLQRFQRKKVSAFPPK